MTSFEAICLICALVAALVGLMASSRTYDMPMGGALAVLIGPSAVFLVGALASLAARTVMVGQ